MATFVKFTEGRDATYINLDLVTQMHRINIDTETKITFANGGAVTVREKPEDLIRPSRFGATLPRILPPSPFHGVGFGQRPFLFRCIRIQEVQNGCFELLVCHFQPEGTIYQLSADCFAPWL